MIIGKKLYVLRLVVKLTDLLTSLFPWEVKVITAVSEPTPPVEIVTITSKFVCAPEVKFTVFASSRVAQLLPTIPTSNVSSFSPILLS